MNSFLKKKTKFIEQVDKRMKMASSNYGKKDGELNGGASSQSLTESYQVPAIDGRMVQAVPLKFCLNFRPPTIAVVYSF